MSFGIGEEHVKSMEKIKDALGKIDAWIKLSGPTSSHIMGDTISFADVWTVSHLKWIQLVVPDFWEEIQLWHDGRWANLLQDFEKYGTVV
jgi:glutathione S-transferase